MDTDSDSIGNNADIDDDNDGYADSVEAVENSDPLDPNSIPADLDSDFIPDSTDTDIDGDGYLNNNDPFPRDSSEWLDTDADSIGNNADTDDDNDGYIDSVEAVENSDPLDPNSIPADLDSDFIPDSTDTDIDGDGYLNTNDVFPRDNSEWLDTDSDTIGNNADPDDDNDGYSDSVETSENTDPLDPNSIPADLDGDFIPDSVDDDVDGDGYLNSADAFPGDSTEWIDNDLDGVGNNKDTDDDNDGYPDSIEDSEGSDPLNAGSVPLDSDGDFIPDSLDPDIDNDGYPNESDDFPYLSYVSLDSDQDGYADLFNTNCDLACRLDHANIFDQFPNNSASAIDRDLDGKPDYWNDNCDESCQISSGLIIDSLHNDLDNDGINDLEDVDDNNDGVIDIDANSNALVDIYNLTTLDAVRHNLAGSGLKLSAEQENDHTGCPVVFTGENYIHQCNGYELIADIEFDSNQDKIISSEDEFWNDGSGWLPIGIDGSTPFATTFKGNGHIIRNLYINRPETDIVGLFGYLSDSGVTISELAVTTAGQGVTGRNYVGVIAGYSINANLNSLYISGTVTSITNAGVAIGRMNSTNISNVFVSGKVSANQTFGGLSGSSYSSRIDSVLSSTMINGSQSTALLGISDGSYISKSYWVGSAEDTDAIIYAGSTAGVSLSELQCPQLANSANCSLDGAALYENWDNEVWDFGSDRQLPGLIMNGVIYRDSDGDGTLDVNYSPTIELLLTQDGREESTIVEGTGYVTIEATITDENGWDYHSVEWSSDDINLADSYELGNSITFSSDGLVAGDYTISVTVTDTGIPQLSDTAEMTIRVISNVDPAPSASSDEGGSGGEGSGGGGSGGGAMFWLLALLSAPLLIGRVRA